MGGGRRGCCWVGWMGRRCDVEEGWRGCLEVDVWSGEKGDGLDQFDCFATD